MELMIRETEGKYLHGPVKKYKVGRHGRGDELIDPELIEAKNSVKALRTYIQHHPGHDSSDVDAIVEDTWTMGNYRHFMFKDNSYVVIPE